MTIMQQIAALAKGSDVKLNGGTIADAINGLAMARGGSTEGTAISRVIGSYNAQALEYMSGEDGKDLHSVVMPGAKFIDYDGTILHYYSREEAMDLKSLPANPSREGLTAQGWNWSLESIKSYLTKYPDATITVGQMYITDDGKTRIYLDVRTRLTIPLTFYQSISEAVTLNWGDGSDEETVSGTGTVTTSHTYSEEGKYLLTFEVTDDDCQLNFGDPSATNKNIFGSYYDHLYNYVITDIHLGKNVTSLGNRAFYDACLRLESIIFPKGFRYFAPLYVPISDLGYVTGIVIPDSVDSFYEPSVTTAPSPFGAANYLSEMSFPAEMTGIFGTVNTSGKLTTLAIPQGVTLLSQCGVACYALKKVTIPDSVESITASSFSTCHSLNEIYIPDSVTSLGNSSFWHSYGLKHVRLSENLTEIGGNSFAEAKVEDPIIIPESVTSLGAACYSYSGFTKEIVIHGDISTISNQAFTNCSKCERIEITGDVTSIGNEVFDACSCLKELILPDTLTSIGKMAFRGCANLHELTIPENVASIGEQAFMNCYTLHDLYVLPTTPPTLEDSVNAMTNQPIMAVFRSMPSDCVIHVPTGTGNTYKAATGWSDFASQIVETPA